MLNLLEFKRAPLPPIKHDRYVRWSQTSAETAAIKFGIFFGALSAAPLSHAKGQGVPLSKLTFGMLVFPKVWDWFLRWREGRRGFFSSDDVRYLEEARALLISPTGWIRHQRQLANRLRPTLLPGTWTLPDCRMFARRPSSLKLWEGEMGWASLIEDNDKLREHWARVCRSLDSLENVAAQGRYLDKRHAEFRADDLSNRVKKLVAEFKDLAQRIHDEAIRQLSDPNVRFVERHSKTEKQLKATRSKLDRGDAMLQQSRIAFDALQRRYNDLAKKSDGQKLELARLKSEVDRLNGLLRDSQAWSSEAKSIKRNRK